jgi:hypothetical protein
MTPLVIGIVGGLIGALVAGHYWRVREADERDRARRLERVAWAGRRLVASSVGEELAPRYTALADALDELDGVDIEATRS